MKSIKLISFVITMLFSFLTFGQEPSIHGIISDDSGPLPGATVVVKGTHIGTQSDIDGKFSIKVSKKDTLIFSYIGMNSQSIAVKERNTINVELNEASKIEEKIPECVGVPRKKIGLIDVTIISKKDLEEIKPLYVLNGFPITLEELRLFDYNKIISINIIKGAAATALYGQQAIGGVTIITSKILTKKEWKKYNKLTEEEKLNYRITMLKEANYYQN